MEIAWTILYGSEWYLPRELDKLGQITRIFLFRLYMMFEKFA